MKNIFNINQKNSAKPAAYFIVFLIVIAFAYLLAGCGSDNPVMQYELKDSLLWKLDSFTIYSDVEPHVNFSNYTDTTNEYRKYKVVYSITSNVPITNDTAEVSYICMPNPGGNITWLASRNEELTIMNVEYTFSVDTNTVHTRIKHYFDVAFYPTYPTNKNHYITVKNFQLYLIRQ